MNLHDYELVKNYDYSTCYNHLFEKYGAVGGDYFTPTFSPNMIIKRADEGLYIHHIDEDKVANLSNYEVARANSFEYQRADRLVYADLFEHILLHILIGEQNRGLGFGGAEIMLAQANDMIWNDEEREVLNLLKERCRNSINAYETLLTHNQTVFYELDNTLIKSDKALVVIGTGLGKTTTALAYIRKYDMRALVLGPNNVITQAWDKEPDVDTMTYQGFMNKYSTIDFSQYGVLICDEAHHCAAPRWGEGVRYVLDNKLVKVIGLTATPKEDKKEKTNYEKSTNFFAGCVCKGFSVLDGIEREIIHDFSYVGAIFDTSGIKEKYADISDKTLLGELDLALNNTPTVKAILLKHMPTNKRKGIIFVSNIAAMDEAEEIMRDIFPKAEYRRMHSLMPYNEVEETREWFQNTDEGYLLAVNMISEGAHYKGVNTIIMFRRTRSSLVFNQQLGRIITLMSDEDPHAIVFDLVNNAENLDEEKGFSASLRESYAQRKARGGKEKSEQIIVEDYAEAISDVLRKIKEGLCNPTKPVILIELQKFYPSWHEPAQEFGVTRKAIQLACLGGSETCAGYHWAYADDKNRINLLQCYIGGVRKTTEVVCKEYPNQVFANAREAEETTGDDRKQINACCQHTKISVNGRHYAFYWEFLQKGASVFVQESKRKDKHKRKVRCIETGEIFESATAAAKWLGLGHDSVASCCRNRERGKITICGGYHWEYVE
jgi:superfamily II DNA or RNA helicase